MVTRTQAEYIAIALSRVVTAAVLLCGLVSCGFQLRGQVDLPDGISSLYLRTTDQRLHDELALLLEAGGANLVENADEADAVLEVGDGSFRQRVLSVDPQTGKPREYQLGYVVTFSFKPRTGPAVAEGEEVRLVRDLLFDDEAVIGKLEERTTLYAEMRRDAAQQILLRLRVRMTP